MKLPISPALAALVCGCLYPLALAPFELPALGILSAAGLAAVLVDAGPRQLLRRCLCYGLGLFGVGASWVYVSIHTYGEAPAPLAAAMTALFVAALALSFALPFLPFAWLSRDKPAVVLLGFPSAWVLSEWFRGWFLTGFPWLYLGHGHIDTWLAGWAPVGGVLSVSGIAALTSAAIALVVRRQGQVRVQLLALLAVLSLWTGGLALTHKQWTRPAGQPLTVALLQPALPLEQKWDNAALSRILELYSDETDKIWDQDLIIWPESAVPRLLEDVGYYFYRMDAAAREHGATLITGIPTRYGGGTYNSVIALGEGGGIYHKRHLVPFGEYVPLEQWLRGTIRFFDLPMSSFSGGALRQPLLQAGVHPVATAICYEIAYQDLVAASAAGAEMLLTVSNDTWFGASIGPHQHFQIARMRALENGKPLLRGTNDGVTAIIDARGKVRAQLPQFERGVLLGEVTPRRGSTPFNRFLSYPVVALSLSLLAALLWFSRRP